MDKQKFYLKAFPFLQVGQDAKNATVNKVLEKTNSRRPFLTKQSINYLWSVLQTVAIVAGVVAGLYWTSDQNYLLFHSLAEIFSIVIAFTIFLISWNTRKYIQSHYFLFIGIAYLFIAGLDLIHTLAFPGMPIFEYNFYAAQFWIAARFMESLSFLMAFSFIGTNKKINPHVTFLIYLTVFALVVMSVLWWEIFPTCFIEGVGQTPFKIVSEYVIILILIGCITLLQKFRSHFDPKVFRLLSWSFSLTILSELSFTMYIDNYDIANFAGHILKIFSFFLIYKAILETGFKKPISFFFRELKQNEEALKSLNATKDKFFSIIAHDLKGPFNSLIGFSDILIKKYDVFTDDERRHLYVMINSSSKKAHNLLDNLLQWSTTQTGILQTNPEQFDIAELVKENIDLLQESAGEKGININFSDDREQTVFADKNMISTVLRNFINNAIKFTHPKGTITIEINSHSENVKVSIADTGVGISREALNNLFSIDKYKTTPGTANEKGSGLGLIVCKEFIEKNNGQIIAESELGKGSRFSFTLPKVEKSTSSQWDLNFF
jgi:signal transduction histidine kinase